MPLTAPGPDPTGALCAHSRRQGSHHHPRVLLLSHRSLPSSPSPFTSFDKSTFPDKITGLATSLQAESQPTQWQSQSYKPGAEQP